MSRLRTKYHIQFNDYPAFQRAYKNTDPATLPFWQTVAESTPRSAYAVLWSLWKMWNAQFNDPTITNWCYIGWAFWDLRMIWPYGKYNIPSSALGIAKCGYAIGNLDKKNAFE